MLKQNLFSYILSFPFFENSFALPLLEGLLHPWPIDNPMIVVRMPRKITFKEII